MLKLVLFISCVGLAVAYDFKDPLYNEVLLEELLLDAEDTAVLGRFRRSPAEDSMDDKCKQRRFKCCNDANGENLDKIHEVKKQCFTEVREKNKADGAHSTPVDLFSCERLNRTKMEIICAMECVGRKKEIVDIAGNLLEPKLAEFVRVNFASDEWQQPLIAGQIETCVKEAKEKSAKQPREPGQCNPEACNFGYCMWRQVATACPKEKQVANRRCDRMRERLANNEPLHYYKAELDD